MTIMVNMTLPASDSGRPVSDVKARFSEYVRAAEHGEHILISRHGRVVAAIVGADELERLERLRAVGPEHGLVSLAGGWEESSELADVLEGSDRQGTRGASLD
jgi:prevent-host-death family protein